jgi:stage V sporulation protein R
MKEEKRREDILQLAKSFGLDPYPVVHEVVERTTMFNVCAYGLPTRARHWSYGRSYDHQKTHGEMGLSKVYEIILNNDPSYAFLLDTNSEVQNLFIVAHCVGHSDFFKNNCMFQSTNRNMIRHAAQHAGRIEEYIEKYGLEKVEHMMDIGFGLDDHIDWHKGLHRKLYGKKHVETRYRKRGEFDDLLLKKQNPTIIRQTVNDKFPPRPEKDLLWFLINYAPLEDWERDVLDIIREEAFYFYPQRMTKIMNEGWASYWHAELMFKYDGLTAQEHMDFARDHEKVVQPGGNPFRINPYFLGYRIFRDIEKRWDKEYGEGAGRKKMFQVRKEDDDISFLRNYLTPELVEELELFTYGYAKNYPKDYNRTKFIIVKEKLRDEIVETMIKPLYNGGAPKISIIETGHEGSLVLRHDSEEISTLDFKFAEKTLEYLWDLWAAPIELHAKDDDGNDILLCFDEAGFYTKSLDEELSFDEEKTEEGNRLILP